MSNHLYPLLLYSYNFSPTPSITFRFPSSPWKLLSRSLSLSISLFLPSPVYITFLRFWIPPSPSTLLCSVSLFLPPPHSHISVFLPLELFCHQSLLFFYTSSPLLIALHNYIIPVLTLFSWAFISPQLLTITLYFSVSSSPVWFLSLPNVSPLF